MTANVSDSRASESSFRRNEGRAQRLLSSWNLISSFFHLALNPLTFKATQFPAAKAALSGATVAKNGV